MSNEDDNSTEGEPSQHGRGRDTLLSSEFAAPIADVLEASTKPDFEAPTTQLSNLPDFSDEEREDVRKTVDRVWEEMFEAEETRPSQILSFPEDRLAALSSESEVEEDQEDEPSIDERPTTESVVDHSFEGSLDDLDIEEKLPEPIRADTAVTLEDRITDEVPMRITPYPGDNTPITAFADARTQLLESPFEQDPIVAKLVAVEGPAKGQEFFASSLRNSVGRGTTNVIVVPDLAMSREHFEVVRNADDTFALVDLKSINGTLLNGTRVREADLYHGDRVEAGQSRFQFVLTPHPAGTPADRRVVRAVTATVDGGRKAAAAQAGTTANRLVVIVGVGALVVSVALFAIVAILKLERAPEPEPVETPDATSHYLRGVEAVKRRDWDAAQTEFAAAAKLDPKLDGVVLQLERIEAERAAQHAVDEARAAYEAGRDLEALATLEQVPVDSVYATDAAELARSVRARQVTDLYQQAQQALAAGDAERARKLAADILTRVPSHRGALQIIEAEEPVETAD